MEYNTVRTKMLMPEYGRNIQGMAEYLLTIEDRAKRLKNAEAVIEIMAILKPDIKMIEDYRHKLWDHLHQMTDFRLDVDSPYPPATAEEVRRKPEVLPYPQHKIRHRHLGKNIEAVLEKGLAETDEEKKQGFAQHIGYYMKLAYATWHKEPVHDEMVKAELAQLSKGEMQFDPGGGYQIHFDPREVNKHQSGGNRNAARKNKPNNGNNNNNSNRNFSGNSSNNAQGGMGGGGNNKNRKFYKKKNREM